MAGPGVATIQLVGTTPLWLVALVLLLEPQVERLQALVKVVISAHVVRFSVEEPPLVWQQDQVKECFIDHFIVNRFDPIV